MQPSPHPAGRVRSRLFAKRRSNLNTVTVQLPQCRGVLSHPLPRNGSCYWPRLTPGPRGNYDPIKFGSERYSKEESIAELGAAFLSNEAGILDNVVFLNSAGYLHSWITKLEEDHTLLTSASSHAQRGFDWVTGLHHEEQEKVREEFPIRESPELQLSPLTHSNDHRRLPTQEQRLFARRSMPIDVD
jgi:hypothetical protein